MLGNLLVAGHCYNHFTYGDIEQVFHMTSQDLYRTTQDCVRSGQPRTVCVIQTTQDCVCQPDNPGLCVCHPDNPGLCVPSRQPRTVCVIQTTQAMHSRH